jgi:Cu-Zn family superoxide dismutase
VNTTHRIALFALAGAVACGAPAPPPRTPIPAPGAGPVGTTATATIRDLAGNRVGDATFTDTYAGVLVAGTVSGVGLGAHGVHIHAVGRCDPPFTSAGGHFNPDGKQHGYKNASGPHLGDLPNIVTPAAGPHQFEFLLPGVTLARSNALLSADGSAIVIHAGHDDYATDPSGNSGARLACGVITP